MEQGAADGAVASGTERVVKGWKRNDQKLKESKDWQAAERRATSDVASRNVEQKPVASDKQNDKKCKCKCKKPKNPLAQFAQVAWH